jgi:hypothetical protein
LANAIGLVRTLGHVGRIESGQHKIEMPSSVVTATLHESEQMTVENVPPTGCIKMSRWMYRNMASLQETRSGGGNWLFLANAPRLSLALANVVEFSRCAQAIKAALSGNGITSTNGAKVEHIELFGMPESSEADSRNFVLCPSDASHACTCWRSSRMRAASAWVAGCFVVMASRTLNDHASSYIPGRPSSHGNFSTRGAVSVVCEVVPMDVVGTEDTMQHFLYFSPLPRGPGSFRPIPDMWNLPRS